VHVSAGQKFIGIVIIVALSRSCIQNQRHCRSTEPLFKLAYGPMKLVAILVGLVLKIILLPFKLIIGLFKSKPAAVPNPEIT
jgi:hypothetical protein